MSLDTDIVTDTVTDVVQNNWSASDVVTLDVGGTLFKTSIGTLTNKSEYFKYMFAGQFKENMSKDKPIFIDRDPELFKIVLSYLRNSNYSIDQTIIEEFKYYLIEIPKHLVQRAEIKKEVVLIEIFNSRYFITGMPLHILKSSFKIQDNEVVKTREFTIVENSADYHTINQVNTDRQKRLNQIHVLYTIMYENNYELKYEKSESTPYDVIKRSSQIWTKN